MAPFHYERLRRERERERERERAARNLHTDPSFFRLPPTPPAPLGQFSQFYTPRRKICKSPQADRRERKRERERGGEREREWGDGRRSILERGVRPSVPPTQQSYMEPHSIVFWAPANWNSFFFSVRSRFLVSPFLSSSPAAIPCSQACNE
jgi:hypothetical protein